MNLQQTIDELEQQAAKYTQAANSLRALLGQEVALPEESVTPVKAPSGNRRGPKTKAEKIEIASNAPKTRVVSPESRAKLSAMMTARHQQRREEKEKAAAGSK